MGPGSSGDYAAFAGVAAAKAAGRSRAARPVDYDLAVRGNNHAMILR